MIHLIEEKERLAEKQISAQEVPLERSQSLDQNNPVSPDILRLLDLLARIEIRRQTRQQLVNKEKAS